MKIETDRLRLVAQTKDNTAAAIMDKELFGKLLNAKVPEEWPHEMMADAEPYFAEKLAKDPDSVGWWGWYIILKSSLHKEDILVGGAGFLGRPTSEGVIVMGYSILTEFEGKGIVTEACKALISWAFNNSETPHPVTCIAAETFPTLPLSIRIMEKCGLTFVGKGSEEGTIRYERKKSETSISDNTIATRN